MLTDSIVADFVALAGPDLQWTGVSGGSRPPSSYPLGKGSKCPQFRNVLRSFLAAGQGGICPQCGDVLGDAVEFCHIVARGNAVKGFHAGNVFAGHPACNASTKPLYNDHGALIHGVEVLTPAMLARPDVVVTVWPRFSELARQAVGA